MYECIFIHTGIRSGSAKLNAEQEDVGNYPTSNVRHFILLILPLTPKIPFPRNKSNDRAYTQRNRRSNSKSINLENNFESREPIFRSSDPSFLDQNAIDCSFARHSDHPSICARTYTYIYKCTRVLYGKFVTANGEATKKERGPL